MRSDKTGSKKMRPGSSYSANSSIIPVFNKLSALTHIIYLKQNLLISLKIDALPLQPARKLTWSETQAHSGYCSFVKVKESEKVLKTSDITYCIRVIPGKGPLSRLGLVRFLHFRFFLKANRCVAVTVRRQIVKRIDVNSSPLHAGARQRFNVCPPGSIYIQR